MSRYEDYDKISVNYDKTRKVVGLEIILGFLARHPNPLEELVILDAGCGTGNYSVELNDRVRRVVCADFSRGMLQKASDKLAETRAGAHNLVQCDLGELPFSENIFDAIICNQSLHHLDEPGKEFVNLKSFLKSAAKALKSDGLLIINTLTHEQLRDGVWWGELIKPAVDRMIQRFPSVAKLEEFLSNCGLKITNRVVPIDAIMQEVGYFDHNSLRQQEFRNGDSHFSLLTEEDLKHVLQQLDALENDGKITDYIHQRDAIRMQIGQFTFFIIRKCDNPDVKTSFKKLINIA